LSPTEIRDLLIATGFDADGRNNLLSEVHQILKRVASRPKTGVEKIETDDGTLYVFKKLVAQPLGVPSPRSPKKKSSLNGNARN
jgi:hypothetical protein